MLTRMRRCLFCDDEAAQVTLEHTLFLPIRSLLGDGPFETLRMNHYRGRPIERTIYPSADATFQRKAFCQSCNGGWMQALDHEAIALGVGKMVQGHDVTLSVTDQSRLTVWATKIALVYEALNGRNKAVPDARYHWFHKERRPFPDKPIQLAHYTGPARHIYGRRLLTWVNEHGQVVGNQAVIMTIVIGEYIAQSVLPTEGGIGNYVPEEGTDRITLWPPLIRPVTWPPYLEVDAAAFPAFTQIIGP